MNNVNQSSAKIHRVRLIFGLVLFPYPFTLMEYYSYYPQERLLMGNVDSSFGSILYVHT